MPRTQLNSLLHSVSDVLPLSYAVDAMSKVTAQADVTAGLLGDLLVVVVFAAATVTLGAATLRRRTA